MRLKALVSHNLATIKRPMAIFYGFFMAGTLFGSIISSLAQDMTVMSVSVEDNAGMSQGWGLSIMSSMIFMLVALLISAQKETRFLITRSVSRKEIFFANAICLLPLSAILAILQMLGVTIDAAVRAVLGSGGFRGLSLDVQSIQAPDMKNGIVFFAVSFSMLVSIGAISYLLGSCFARWKVQTIGVLSVGAIVFFGSLVLPGVFQKVLDVFRFMFTDRHTGILIACKHFAFAMLVMAVAFPVTRRITAARQTQ